MNRCGSTLYKNYKQYFVEYRHLKKNIILKNNISDKILR